MTRDGDGVRGLCGRSSSADSLTRLGAIDRALPSGTRRLRGSCRRIRGSSLLWIITLSLLSSIGAFSFGPLSPEVSPVHPPGQNGPLASAAGFVSHDPIFIDGNSGFTNASGVTWGSGTETDPYVIEGWDITTSSASGIEIRNTDAHFVIRDCLVRGTAHPHAGIRLGNCVNGTLWNNSMSGNYYAIYLESSSGNTIIGNNCSDNWYGMFLADWSSGNAIVDNNCSNNKYDGIELYYLCNNNTITNNTFFDNLDGIHLETSYNNTLAGNVMVRNGMSMLGYVVSECNSHDIDTSNTVNGRQIGRAHV